MPELCFITTCMGRLGHLQQTLGSVVSQAHSSCIVVDYSCPEQCGKWVEQTYPQAKVVRVPGERYFGLSHARNAGAASADAPWLCLVDADMRLDPRFAEAVLPLLQPGVYLRANPWSKGLGGTVICSRQDFDKVYGYDEVFQGWGVEDDDFYGRLNLLDLKIKGFPASLLEQLTHSDDLRVQNYATKDMQLSRTINRLYAKVKMDLLRLKAQSPSLALRRGLYENVARFVRQAQEIGRDGQMQVDVDRHTTALGWECTGKLTYVLSRKQAAAAEPQTPKADPPTAVAPDLPPAPFVVGASRSGTTLLQLMLNAHPDLAIPPETHFVIDLLKGPAAAAQPLEAFLQRVTSNPYWQDQHVDAETLRQGLIALAPFSVGAALRAFYRLYADNAGKSRYGDKTPLYLAYMPQIQALLPEARFIHVIRDGRDVALSMKDMFWGPRTIPDIAVWWTSRIQTARALAERVPYYVEIRYEDLVANTEVTLPRICEFLDLPWDPAMLTYREKAHQHLEMFGDLQMSDGQVIPAERRRAIHERVATAPDQSRIGRWKTEITATERQQFENLAGAILRNLGYEV